MASGAAFACEYKKVPKIAMADPAAFMGRMGFLNAMTEEMMTTTRFMVFPMEKVRALMLSSAWYDTWL